MKTLSLAMGLVAASLVTGAFAQTTETTTTRTYDSTVTRPLDSGASATPIPSSEPMMDQSTIYDEDTALDQQRMEERMEERQNNSSTIIESGDDNTTDAIDYSDRTRTNRERKAIDTSSDASDDE